MKRWGEQRRKEWWRPLVLHEKQEAASFFTFVIFCYILHCFASSKATFITMLYLYCLVKIFSLALTHLTSFLQRKCIFCLKISYQFKYYISIAYINSKIKEHTFPWLWVGTWWASMWRSPGSWLRWWEKQLQTHVRIKPCRWG